MAVYECGVFLPVWRRNTVEWFTFWLHYSTRNISHGKILDAFPGELKTTPVLQLGAEERHGNAGYFTCLAQLKW